MKNEQQIINKLVELIDSSKITIEDNELKRGGEILGKLPKGKRNRSLTPSKQISYR